MRTKSEAMQAGPRAFAGRSVPKVRWPRATPTCRCRRQAVHLHSGGLVRVIDRGKRVESTLKRAGAPSVAVAHGHVIGLDKSGSLGAWHTDDLSFDAAFTRQLAGPALLAVAGHGGELWAVGERHVLQWESGQYRWVLRSGVPWTDELLERFVVGDTFIVLVYSSRVYEVLHRSTWPVPSRRHPNVTDVLAGKERLWIAHAFGEWGGLLLGMDLATGSSSECFDRHLYPTGICADADDVIVNWGQGHLQRRYCVRTHGSDGKVRDILAQSEEHFLFGIARTEDGHMFSVEDEHLVTIVGGKLTSRVALGRFGLRGVTTLTVADRDTVLVVPEGRPIRAVRNGAVIVLNKD